MTLRIATVVHGRFYAFDLVRALLQGGVAATLFTNYPPQVARRFGIDAANVRSNVFHGVASRVLQKLHAHSAFPDPEPILHPAFSKWAARAIGREKRFDAVQCFSGVAEELFLSLQGAPLRILVRGSAHISCQARLLEEEAARAGKAIDRPSPWIVARERREYELADVILVLSSFARQSFAEEGLAQKMFVLPLGADLARFRSDAALADERDRRIRGSARLRVLTTGTFSFRKGALDLAAIARALHDRCEFRFVGTVLPEAAQLARECAPHIEFVAKVDEFDLPRQYAWADVFLFPTVEDGYAAVLSQAQASGLPLLTTTNCAGPDIVSDGRTGWILPIRRADLMQEVLVRCDEDRAYLAAAARASHDEYAPRDWSDVARDFERFVASRTGAR